MTKIYDRVTHDYKLSPAKPTGLGEGAYENGPEYPTKPITALVIRRQAYWSYLAGGYHTYGNTSIWNFGIEPRYVKKPWKDALTDPGALHVSVAARFLQSKIDVSCWRLRLFAAAAGQRETMSITKNAATHLHPPPCRLVYQLRKRFPSRANLRWAGNRSPHLHSTPCSFIGQPWLTLLIDDYSRMVVGFYLGFEPPSYAVLMEALRHAILPEPYLKEQFPRVTQ